MKEPNDTESDSEIQELSLKNDKKPEIREDNITWSEVMIGNMIMSETDFGLTLDMQETSIKMSSGDLEETLEFIVKSPEKIKILVDGSTQADISSIEVLKEIGRKIEEKNIASENIIKELLKGKDENFFTKFTALVTLLKLTFLLRQKARGKNTKNDYETKEREKNDSQIGPYF